MKLTIRRGLRAVSVVAAAVALTAGLAAPANAAPPTQRGERVTDVVIVPGQAVGELPYRMLANNLTERGYRVKVLNLPGTDLRGEPAVIGAAVDRILSARPKAKIALVGHSIGGVTARWYLKKLGGHTKVDTYIGIGTPQYGSAGACGADRALALACPGSSYLRELNAGDDTPGSTYYVGIRNIREWVDGHLDGGQCRVRPTPSFAPLPDLGFEHSAEPLDPRIGAAVEAALRGECRGVFVNQRDRALNYKKSEYPNGRPAGR